MCPLRVQCHNLLAKWSTSAQFTVNWSSTLLVRPLTCTLYLAVVFTGSRECIFPLLLSCFPPSPGRPSPNAMITNVQRRACRYISYSIAPVAPKTNLRAQQVLSSQFHISFYHKAFSAVRTFNLKFKCQLSSGKCSRAGSTVATFIAIQFLPICPADKVKIQIAIFYWLVRLSINLSIIPFLTWQQMNLLFDAPKENKVFRSHCQ